MAPILFAFLVIVFWEIIPLWFSVPSYVFPRLSSIAASTWAAKELLEVHFVTTFLESASGFALGSIIGFVVGLLMAESRLFSRIMLPYVIGSNSIPVVAIAPLIILWFGHGIFSKIVLSAFLCFFPLCINCYKGLNEYDVLYEELFRIYGANKVEFLIRFKLPNSIPFIFVGLKLNATFSVIGAIVAEFVGANAGLGFGMLQASYNLNTPRLWGYLIVSCLLGMSMYLVIVLVEKYMLNRHSYSH